MSNILSLPELEDRIAILRDNIRQLVEQAAGAAGGQNEERTADRIQQQTEELEKVDQRPRCLEREVVPTRLPWSRRLGSRLRELSRSYVRDGQYRDHGEVGLVTFR